MQRITLFSVAAVLLLTGTASADLTVYEYVPGSGEFVVEDGNTGKYWYWNLADFVNMTYGEQISAIDLLGTYGYIAGSWHLASLSEMEALWTNSATNIMDAFGSPSSPAWDAFSVGRYESSITPNGGTPNQSGDTYHMIAGLWDSVWTPLGTLAVVDSEADFDFLGAWVTTDANVVPAPPSVVMATTGFLTLLGAKLRGRWRRR